MSTSKRTRAEPLAIQSRPAEGLPAAKPLVFISHDTRDADLAAAFGSLLRDASGGTLKSFRSSDRKGTAGIEFGAEWYKAIMDTLASATDVVALLTPHSVNRPWILYEVGVAKGKLNTTAFGIALGVPFEVASTGPFAQFQNSSDDEDSLTKLVLQLIRRNPDADPSEDAVRRQVQAFRATLDGFAAKATHVKAPAPSVDENTVAKLFEEVKVLFRELPDQVEQKVQMGRRPKGRRGRWFHSHVFDELLFRFAESDRDSSAAAWLVFISYLRDELPWLYEAGIEVYRALLTHNKATLSRARKQFLQVVEMLTKSRFLYELHDGDKELYTLYHRLPEMMDHFLSRAIDFTADEAEVLLAESRPRRTARSAAQRKK